MSRSPRPRGRPSADPGPASPAGRLLLIATPIGHLDDITVRAVRALREVDELYAEDTRVTADLLRHLGIARATRSCHDHNEEARADEVLAHLCAGRTVGVVSDAGTPLISDPGFRVVARARAAGFVVDVLPGPCAAVTAVVGSGLATDRFAFGGFLPASASALRACLATFAPFDGTLVFYESPRRLAATLAVLAEVWPGREVVVARNLTKEHEQWLAGSAADVLRALGEEARGEVVLLVGRGQAEVIDPDERIRAMLADGADPRQIRDVVAALTGRPRREIYARVLALRA